MNIRKWLCKDVIKMKKSHFLYAPCDCKRYEYVPPEPPEPPDPPDVTPKPPFIGTSYYQLVSAPGDHIRDFLTSVKDAGGNMTEVFFDFTWQGGWGWQPYSIVNFRPDPGSGFGDYKFPVFDLDTWEESNWNKWRYIFNLCQRIGLCLFVRIMDQCSLKDRFERRRNAFRSNIQRLDQGVLTGGLYGTPIRKWYDRLNARLIGELRDSGVAYKIVPWNEFDIIPNGWTPEECDAVAVENMRWWVSNLISHGAKKEDIILSISRARNEMVKIGCLMEEHGINSDKSLSRAIEHLGPGFFPNGDGPDPYAEGRPGDRPNKREPSIVQARKMREIITQNGMWYGYFNRNTEYVDTPDVRAAQFDVLRVLTGKDDGPNQ